MTAGSRPLGTAYDVALLDLDGVVYIGGTPIPGAPEALQQAKRGGRITEDDDAPVLRSAVKRIKRTGGTSTAAPRKTKAIIQLPSSVRSFSEALGISASQVLGKLLAMELGRELDVPLPTTAATNEFLTAARGMGWAKQDFAVVFDVLARMSGVLK